MGSSDGAIAGLIDITCLYGTADFAESQDDIFKIWEGYTGPNPFETIFYFSVDFNITLQVIGVHYFINYDGAFLPKFDFTSAGPTDGNTDAFVVGSIDIAVTAPDGAHDVNWLEIRAVSGKFADEVYCVETRGGQPPDSVSSVRLYFVLLVQPFDLRSAPLDPIRSLSTMWHNTVSAHGLTISMWPLLTLCIQGSKVVHSERRGMHHALSCRCCWNEQSSPPSSCVWRTQYY